jgi:hypothetical protein
MRRIVPAGLVAAIAVAALAIPASASFDHHFSVIERQTSSDRSGDTFSFKGKLFATFNRHDRVGRDRGECTQGARKVRCAARAHLNGEVGGFGDIKVKGNLGRHDDRLNVVGGSGDFNGVAGKVLVHDLGHNKSRLHFDLTH